MGEPRSKTSNPMTSNNDKLQGRAMTTKVIARDGKIGEGIKFERIRRITGYLVGSLDRFNNAKAAEVRERVKHGGTGKA